MPRPMLRSIPSDAIRVVGLSVEIEGLGVVPQSVGGGQRFEGGIGRLARVVEGLGPVARTDGR